MEAMICDRCNKFYVIPDRSDERPSCIGHRIFGVRVLGASNEHLRKFDLCTDCAIEVYNFLNNIPIEASLLKCNECKYYEGVHKVQGHAPCSYHTIGGVMWDWHCSQFEAYKESEEDK